MPETSCKFDIDLSSFYGQDEHLPFRSDIVSTRLSVDRGGTFFKGFDPATSRLAALQIDDEVNDSDLIRFLQSYRKLSEVEVSQEVSSVVLNELQSYALEKLGLFGIRDDHFDLVCRLIERNTQLESLDIDVFQAAVLKAIR